MGLDTVIDNQILQRLQAGDCEALGMLFDSHRERLRNLVRLRIDPRLAGRIDPDDVLQEAWLAAQARTPHLASSSLPPYLWLRLIALQTLHDLRRRHLGAEMRSANFEVSLLHGVPMASSAMLARQLSGSQTSPSQAAMRAEHAEHLVASLGRLAPIDREILLLRHFEELGNDEAATVLGLSRTAASNRYVRAIARLRAVLDPERSDA